MSFWKAFWRLLLPAILSASCKHAELQSLMHIPYPQMERPRRHIGVASDKHWGLCLRMSIRKEGRQQINKLPALCPICKHCLFCSAPPPSRPCPTPVLYQIATLSSRPLAASSRPCDGLIPCLSLAYTSLPADPHFHCTILLSKKCNHIDPKPNGKRWSVNTRVLNNGCSVLLRGDGRMGYVRDGGVF